jgi:hypothetical protein
MAYPIVSQTVSREPPPKKSSRSSLSDDRRFVKYYLKYSFFGMSVRFNMGVFGKCSYLPRGSYQSIKYPLNEFHDVIYDTVIK